MRCDPDADLLATISTLRDENDHLHDVNDRLLGDLDDAYMEIDDLRKQVVRARNNQTVD